MSSGLYIRQGRSRGQTDCGAVGASPGTGNRQAAQMQSQQFLSRVRKFALSLEQLTRDEKEETLLEETPKQ